MNRQPAHGDTDDTEAAHRKNEAKHSSNGPWPGPSTIKAVAIVRRDTTKEKCGTNNTEPCIVLSIFPAICCISTRVI